MTNKRKRYAEAIWQLKSRIVDYTNSESDPAFGFQAYLCWREAVPMRQAAIDEMCEEQVRLALSVGNEFDSTRFRQKLNEQFDRFQAAVFAVLDEIALCGIEPTARGNARATKFKAAYLVGQQMLIRRHDGATQDAIFKAVAKQLGVSPANVRRLNDDFIEEKALEGDAAREFKALQRRMKERRTSSAALPKQNRAKKEVPHSWRR